MKILVCKSPGVFEYQEVAKPVLTKGNVIIRIRRIGICGTDLHAFKGIQPYFEYPRVLGHELSGEIVELEKDLPGFNKGDAVTFIPYFSCGKCIACRSGKPNCCVSIQVFGVHIDGGMAEYVSVPADALVKGNGLNYDELAMVEPLSIGAHGVRRAAIQPEEFVLIIGAGPIGIGTMLMAGIAGAQVIAMDINETRLAFCKKQLGIRHLVNPTTSDPETQLSRITNGDMPTVIIDATGNQHAINNAFHYLAHGGRYILIGLQKEDIIFNHPQFHKREATLMSSRNATREDFEYVTTIIRNKQLSAANYITHKVTFDEVKTAFTSWQQPDNGVIKAMVTL
ncbi:zinc-binding alcohol dehydrogenase family protein [Chitinophaga defluvii]|uniref:Zinc-binding alcohol dehydrogenase family protein n=1 Tax=Chitinophaga defluvii TaxID=3163343 RepID=A0ABV2T4E2_9BACT